MLSAASSSSAGYQRVASSDALVTPISGPPPSATSPGVRQTPSSNPPPNCPTSQPHASAVAAVGAVPPPHMQHMMTGPPPGPSGHYGPPMQPGGQGQILCSGCRTLLVYPQGASNVRCSLCQFVTAVLPQGSEMAQLVCGGCRTPLMYVRGASSVQCSLCHTVNLAMEANRIGYVNCAGCGQTLMYSAGAQSVKCAVCQFVTQAAAGMTRMPLPSPRPPYMGPQPLHPQPQQQLLQQPGPPRTQTVIVENPDTLDESGQVVSNVAVGVTSTDKKV